MKLRLGFSEKEARSLSIVLVAARLFTHMYIDGTGVGNAAWICVLAGTVLALPLGIMADLRSENSGFIGKLGLAVICAVGVFEAAAVLGLITDTIKCSGMLRANSVWIAGLTLGGCAYAVFKNGAGLCNAVKIWIYVLSLLMAIIAIAQMRLYRPAWLLPILGPGFGKLAEGTVAAAGIAAAAPMLHTLSDRDKSVKMSCTKSMLISGVTAAVLCALRGMMAPVITGTNMSRFTAIDMVIANGRETLSLQLPLLLAVYGGYISSICGYCLMSATALQRCLGGMSGKICAIIAVGAVYALNTTGFAGRGGIMAAAGWEFAAAALAVTAVSIKNSRRERTAAA